MYKIVLTVSVVIIVVCTIIIGMKMFDENQSYQAVSSRLITRSENVSLGGLQRLPVMEITDLDGDAEILPQWREHYNRNNHFIGWLKLGDTILNYPVMQYLEDEFDGNRFYLYHDFDRNPHDHGVPFVDWHTPIVNKRRPDNIVMYAHNMNSGDQFATLIKYNATPNGRDLTAYYTNPTIDFTTIYDDERSTYKIFAAMFVNTTENHGEVFNYYQKRFFSSKSEFYNFIGNVMDRSLFYTDVDIKYGDEILTMSTCYFPLESDTHRFVVIARRVREGESPAVDTSAAYINPDPLYFDYYYQVKGGYWTGRTWDTSKVKGFDEFNEKLQ